LLAALNKQRPKKTGPEHAAGAYFFGAKMA